MKKFKFVTIKEREVEIDEFNNLETCTNLLKIMIEREINTKKYYGVKERRYMSITDDTGKILAEWKDKD